MNLMKTTFLLALLTGLFVIVGNAIGGPSGGMMALVFAVIMNFGMYWFSDKIVLKMYRAKVADRTTSPLLFATVERLALKAQMPMPKVYIIEDHTPNAFATGRDPAHASVAATTGILALLNKDELEGVMAHELAHVKNRDTLISTIAASIAGAITWLAQMAQWAAMFGGGRSDDDDNRGGVVGMLLMAVLAPIAAMLIQMAISRSREYIADKSGAQMCGKPLSLASALGRLENGVKQIPMQSANPSTAHMFIVHPFKASGIFNLFSTHPPMEKRIERLRMLAQGKEI